MIRNLEYIMSKVKTKDLQVSLIQNNQRNNYADFFLKLHPSVSLALPPVGWASMIMQDVHWMTVCACENTMLMEVHPGHLTSMK